jgi:phage terminase small subunit
MKECVFSSGVFRNFSTKKAKYPPDQRSNPMRASSARKNGPSKTPASILRARGSSLAKHRQDLKVPEGEVACPTWISEGGRQWWEQLAPQLEEMGLLTVLDAVVFGLMCDAMSDYEFMKDHDATIAGKREQRRHMVALAREFGLTPAARASLAVPAARTVNDRPPHGNAARKHEKSRYFTLPAPGSSGQG